MSPLREWQQACKATMLQKLLPWPSRQAQEEVPLQQQQQQWLLLEERIEGATSCCGKRRSVGGRWHRALTWLFIHGYSFACKVLFPVHIVHESHLHHSDESHLTRSHCPFKAPCCLHLAPLLQPGLPGGPARLPAASPLALGGQLPVPLLLPWRQPSLLPLQLLPPV